jgi:DNA-binding transcriptional ArsR family regulator
LNSGKHVTIRSPIDLVPPAGEVFRALADPTRRAVLDALLVEDAQTLSQLCSGLPSLTRFTVMKHLGVLEQAGLVVTEKVGRHKRHHLNRIPLEQANRWLRKFFGKSSATIGVDELFRSTESTAQLQLW